VNPCGGAASGFYGIAEVAFRQDGRPRRVTVLSGPQQTTCDQILKSAFLLSLAPPDQPTSPDKPIHLQTILQPDVLGCADEIGRDPVVTRGIAELSSLVSPPELLSKVAPIYPNLSGRDRVSGVAILAGTISTSGCVQAIHLVQSSGVLSIDIASMLAFVQWKYSPARLNRQAIAFPTVVRFTYKLYD
jgi:TonB family protein